jgi:hypothetical protein
MTLEQLSAAATEGEAMSYAKSIVEAVEQGCNYEDKCLAVRDWLLRYRTGQLVAVADDAIERVAKIAAEAYFARQVDAGYITTPCTGGQDWINVATAVIAAMKDTQPALKSPKPPIL